jgi:branched-chain amino acid aminotransferase
MFAKEAFLGVRPADKVAYYVIASPAGAYFAGGVAPVSIWLSTHYVRAAEGGTGSAKTGGNYAASLLPQAEAYQRGCQQVLFLDAGGNLEELGGMNVVLVRKDGTLVTPESDSILEGITRDSVLQLARDRGHAVESRKVTIDEWREGAASGDIVGAFACGTAAVIVPIGRLLGEGIEIVHDGPESEALARSLREELTGIQYGRVEDRYGWLIRLDG